MEPFLLEAPCLYFACEDDGTIVEANNPLCRQLGFLKEELVGKKADVIFTLATRIFYQTHLFPLVQMQGNADEIYLTLQTKEKTALPVLLNAQRNKQTVKPVTAFACIIVHNRKKFEDELVAAKKAAESALNENTALLQAKQSIQLHAEQLDQQMQMVKRQNEEMRQFNKVVTHDLQEPLRKLFVFTSMLLEGSDAESRQKAAIKIGTMTTNLRSIVNGLQQYVWLIDTPLKLAAVDLNNLIKVCRLRIAKEHPDVKFDLKVAELPAITADAEQMEFLFYELLCNAVRFRKPGNSVKVTVHASELMQNQFRSVPGKFKYVNFVKLEIADNGVGIQKEYKYQALELFRRLVPGSGRGVGLSLCKKIVENHGGDIALDSQEQKGTTVTVWLPLQKEPDSVSVKTAETKKPINSES